MPARRSWMRRVAIAVGGTLAAIVLVAGGMYERVQYGGNVHVVEPGVIYRSAQLSGNRLNEVARQYGIKSVLNLRGDNHGHGWYDDEIRAAKASGLVHLDYGISAQREVTLAQMREILQVVANAPKPLLIHCNAGADRTGLISAIYEVSNGVPVEVATTQLSLNYGHFPYLWSKTGAMDRSLAAFIVARSPSAPAAP
jgi:protein tyrosine/serine phosphatase